MSVFFLYGITIKKLIPTRNSKLFCLFACLLLSLSAPGQKNSVGLNIEIPATANDTQLLKAYDDILIRYQYSNPDSVIYYMKQGLSEFTAHKYKPGIAGMLVNMAGTYSTEGMLEIAEKADEEALKIYTEINSRGGIANANDVLGVIEGRKGNFSEAVNHFFIALKIFEELNDTDAITDTYIKLGTANENSNNHDKALEYYNKGLNILKAKPVNDVVIFLNSNIGAVYISKNDYPNAMKYLQKALEESNDPAYAQIRLLALTNMGVVCANTGDTGKAINYLDQALAITVKEHLPENRANILISISDLTGKSNPGKALALLNEAMQTAKEISARKLQLDILHSMIEVYKNKGDYKEAFTLLDRQKNLSDSILNIDKERTIANLEALYDLDKLNSKVQHLELSEQKQQQRKNTIAAVAILLTVLLFVLAFFFWKTRLLNAELHKRELRLRKTSMVKNKLISIIAHDLIGSIGFMPLSLKLCKDGSIPVEEKNNLLTQLESNAIASFETLQNMLDWGKSQMQGIVLNQADIDVNGISQEVLQFIKVAADNKQITIKNNITPGVTVFADPNHFKFIFRNLLSNAVKYTAKNGMVQINAVPSGDASHIVFSVKDNGTGISNDKKAEIFESFGASVTGTDNEKGNGIGLKLCREFVVENGGEIWLESEENKGTVFYFSLKTKK